MYLLTNIINIYMYLTKLSAAKSFYVHLLYTYK